MFERFCKKCPYRFSPDEDYRKPCNGCIGEKCFEYFSCKEDIHTVVVPDLIRSGKKGMIL